MTRIERASPCKVNLLLNILGKRPDGFHELETVMQPVELCDLLQFEPITQGEVELTCSNPALPTDSSNLVHRAARHFLDAAKLSSGVRIHLEKRIPLAAGLGGGSGNAGVTLLALNELFDHPLSGVELGRLAASLGSDVPFFLQSSAALGTGRGEQIESLAPFAALKGVFALLIHPGFGVSTPWAYQALAHYPGQVNGQPGRARVLIASLQSEDLCQAAPQFYNALEAPVLHKYPILALYQEFLRAHGALATLMSGSGSTTFALVSGKVEGEKLAAQFNAHFGPTCWTAVAPLR